MLDTNMTDDQIVEKIIDLAENDELKTKKHDPDKLTEVWERFRTVQSHETVKHFEEAIKAEDEFNIDIYENTRFPQTPFYAELSPTAQCRIYPAASGVVGHTPTTIVDRLVIVDGKDQGPHMYGEDSDKIQRMKNDGTLVHVRRLQRSKQGRGK